MPPKPATSDFIALPDNDNDAYDDNVVNEMTNNRSPTSSTSSQQIALMPLQTVSLNDNDTNNNNNNNIGIGSIGRAPLSPLNTNEPNVRLNVRTVTGIVYRCQYRSSFDAAQ
jgi:hypothetical protein